MPGYGQIRRGIKPAALFTVFMLIFTTLAGSFYFPHPARAATTVGTGTPASCDWASFKAAVYAGGDIYFDCGGNHTILFLNNLTIDTNTAIYGNNQITLDGQNTYQLFIVNSGKTLSLDGLTLKGGKAGDGGAVYNRGNLIITNSSFSGNYASNWGGAISNRSSGTTNITGSVFYNNSSASYSGAIDNDGGSLSITNSTFYGNSSNISGAIYLYGIGTIYNSTFSNNTSASFGAISISGTNSIYNSIISNNTGGNCSGEFSSGTGNLQYGGSSCAIGGTPITLSTQNPLSASGLADNGGPTRTIALDTAWASNPALTGGDVATCTNAATVNNRDQRGNARITAPNDNFCSIGAYEAPLIPYITTQPTGSTITAGSAANLSVVAGGGTAPYSYQWYSGISGDTSSPISGATLASYTTGSITTPGTYNYWVKVSDSAFQSVDSQTATVTVNPGAADHFSLSGPATVNAGSAFSLTLTAYDQYNNIATGYTGKVHFTGGGTGASLPADYTFTSGDAGTHIFTNEATLRARDSQTITVTDTVNAALTAGLGVSVTLPRISITPGTLPNASTGAVYSQTFTASGGFSPYTFSLATGNTLPAGLSLASDGKLSGTPTVGGSFGFAIYVTDQYGNLDKAYYPLNIDAPTITLSPASLPDATAGAAYSQNFSASGGTAPYTYALATGSTLPSGLNLTNAGVLSGTPTVSGSYTFSVMATDSSNGSGPFSTTKAYSLNVNAGAASGISVVSGSPQNTTISTAFALPLVVKVTDSNGNPVSGATVSFAPPASGASASLSTPATTGSNGQTSVSATANSTVGSYKVTASITGASTTFNLTNCDPAGCGAADVEIKVASDNPRPEAKQPFTLTTTATNHGPYDVTGLVVSAKIPKGLECQSHASTPGTGYNHNTGAWTIGNLASGVSVSLSIKCATTGAGQVTFKAETTGMNQPDSNPANNAASVSLNAIPERLHADLGAGLTASVSGELVTFNLTIKNLDIGRATYPYLLFPLDPSLELQSAGFGDKRDWVKKVESEGANPRLELRFHDLWQNEQATATLVFRFKGEATSFSLTYQALWDDDFGVGHTHTSNRVSFARGQEGPTAFRFDPAASAVAKGSKPVLSADFFAPDEKVELWYTDAAGKSVGLGYRYADKNGKLGFSFKTAELPEGVYVVAGRGDHSGITVSAVVEVQAKVQHFTPEKSSVKAGEKIRLEGEFFAAGERVTYWYTGAEGKSVELGYLWADSEGRVSFELDTTGMAAGDYTVAANGNTSGVQARSGLEVTQ